VGGRPQLSRGIWRILCGTKSPGVQCSTPYVALRDALSTSSSSSSSIISIIIIRPTLPLCDRNDWGFKLTAKARVTATAEEGAGAGGITDVSPAPFYIGQAPSYVSQDEGVEAIVGSTVRG
jgi:hypothetical protein